jgi:CheY-like chemotaxis protein
MGRERRRHVRVAGPFEAYRVGLIDAPVSICDLSEGGCFVNSAALPPVPGRHLVLKINVPEQGWLHVKAEVLQANPQLGFSVAFVDVPDEAIDGLRRGLRRIYDVSSDAEKDRSVVLPSCPRCNAAAVRPLGMARSTVAWYACSNCDCVWAAREGGSEPESDPADPPSLPRRPGVKQILIADDDGGVLAVLREALSDYGLLTGRNVAEAWAVGRRAPVDLLITDYLMPDGTGAELISRLREDRPSLKVLIVTGHGAMLDNEGFPWWRDERHIAKPFSIGAMRTAVADLIGGPAADGDV